MPDHPGLAEPRICDSCGARIPRHAPGGQCLSCLLSLGSSPDLEGEPVTAGLLEPGQVREFGDYELLEEVARGGMGVVYRAWQRSREREVAVKMILSGHLATPALIARFHNEAAAAAKLDHPNIVPVYEVGEFEGQHFFSMRYVPGNRDIERWAQELPAERRFQAIALALAEVARAVEFAHQRGVLHRDLKPSNVLVDENDEPLVTDFGLAKILDDPNAPHLTVTTAIIGSPCYMAPEQAEPQGRKITAATDVYGLGAILYELLAGTPPFNGPSPLLVARRVVEDLPPRLFDVPVDLATICLKCLEKEPAMRFPTALALAKDLERFARAEPIEAERASTLTQVRAWARRRPAVAALLALLAVALVSGLGAVAWQWRKAEAARRELAGVNRELQATVSHLEWRALDSLLERDYASRALSELSAQLRANPWSWQAATYALSIVEQHTFALPNAPAVHIAEEWLAVRPALDADRQRAAFAATDGRVRLFDASRGVDLCPPLAGQPVGALALSPDGRWCAIGEKGGAVVLCALPSGRVVARTQLPASPLRGLIFSRDSKTIALISGGFVMSGTTEDFAAGMMPLRMISAGFEPGEIRCSADGRTLFAWSTGPAGRAGLWAPAGIAGPLFPEVSRRIRSADLDASGSRIAIADGEFDVSIWDVARREKIVALGGDRMSVSRVTLTPDGRRVLVGDQRGQTVVYSTDTGFPASQPLGQRYQVNDIALDASGTRALVADVDFTARLMDVATGRPLSEPVIHEGRVLQNALSSNGTSALTLCEPSGLASRVLRSLRFRSVETARTFQPLGGRALDPSKLTPDETLVAVGSFLPHNSITVFDTATGRAVLDRAPLEGSVYCSEFTRDGRRLIVATNTGWLYGWHVPPVGEDRTVWRPLWEPFKTGKRAQPVTLSPDDRLIALGCVDGTLRLYDLAQPALVREMVHGALIKGVRFSPDASRVVTAGRDGLIHVWDVSTGERLATLRGHTADVLSAHFSTDATRIVSASYDSTARVWDAATGAPLTPPLQHAGELSLARFSPDGRFVGTASRDGTARIWDAATGRLIFEPTSRPTTMQQVLFLPDGRRFVTVDLLEIRTWDLTTGEPVTVPFPIKAHSGLGLDDPSSQDLLSPHGDHLLISNALDAAIYLPLLDAPAPVPAWFPDFLDDLATSGVGPAGSPQAVPRDRLSPWLKRAADFGDAEGYYEQWLRRYLGGTGPEARL